MKIWLIKEKVHISGISIVEVQGYVVKYIMIRSVVNSDQVSLLV